MIQLAVAGIKRKTILTIIKISDYFEEKNFQVYSVVTNFF